MNQINRMLARHLSIPATDRTDRAAANTSLRKMRPMKSVSGNGGREKLATFQRSADPWTLTVASSSTPGSDPGSSNWLEDLRSPQIDCDKPVEFEAHIDLVADEASLEAQEDLPHTAEIEPNESKPVSVVNDLALEPACHSVNQTEYRLETAYFHLQALELPPDASWNQIQDRYHRIINALNQVIPNSTAEELDIIVLRRNINTAYACLRILSSQY